MSISIREMCFLWPNSEAATLNKISMDLPISCRCILAGSNGTGKSCLMRTIGGLYRYDGSIQVHGKDVFAPDLWGTSTAKEIVAGINVWRNENCVIVGERWSPKGDSKVSTMLQFVSGWSPSRRDMLVERFGIDMDWRVNQLSDGRKRKVQLLLAFLNPCSVLLLDEVTTDLDVLARQSLLDFLKEESTERGTTIVFSTHIFDGLEDWGTHLALLSSAGTLPHGAPALADVDGLRLLREAGAPTPLFTFAETWVRRDRAAGPRARRPPSDRTQPAALDAELAPQDLACRA